MIRLMIVDDEETTRTSLLELVPWAELGIGEVVAAENGIAALALADAAPPDILLTDVRMPKMNGTELARAIRERRPACEIVFLSGYSDKEFLKTAIQVSAADYIEKPVDMGELAALFRKLALKLRREAVKEEENRRLWDSLRRNTPLLRQDCVLELLVKGTAIGELADRYGREALPVADCTKLSVACLLVNWGSAVRDEEKAAVKTGLLKGLCELNADAPPVIGGFVRDSALALVAGTGEPGCRDLLEGLLGSLRALYPGSFTLSGGLGGKTGTLPERYVGALIAAKRQFYEGTGRVYDLDCPAPGTACRLGTKEMEAFKQSLRGESADEAIRWVERLTDAIRQARDPDTDAVRDIYFHLLRLLYEIGMQWDVLEGGDDGEKVYIWQEINGLATLSELADFLVAQLTAVLRRPGPKSAASDKIEEIRKYVNEQYANPQLSIQSIAEHTYLSPTYLCAYFKKSTGRTLHEYITSLRLEKAKQMLENRKLKLHQISAGIGFIDANYFSTLFKKHTGLTPSEFRERLVHASENR